MSLAPSSPPHRALLSLQYSLLWPPRVLALEFQGSVCTAVKWEQQPKPGGYEAVQTGCGLKETSAGAAGVQGASPERLRTLRFRLDNFEITTF